MDALELNLRVTSRPVILEELDGSKTEYEMREMKAADRDSYLTQFAKRCRVNNEGKLTTMQDFNGSEAALITRTLFRKDNGQPVAEKVVQSWPSTAANTIFRAAFELNKLGAETGDAAKNA